MAGRVRPRLQTLWWTLGWALVALVCYLSLTATTVDLEFTFADKVGHLLAYAALMGWFGQLGAAPATEARLAALLVALGVGLEILQGWGGVRQFEYADMLANTAGVALGWAASRGPGGRLLVTVERLLLN